MRKVSREPDVFPEHISKETCGEEKEPFQIAARERESAILTYAVSGRRKSCDTFRGRVRYEEEKGIRAWENNTQRGDNV